MDATIGFTRPDGADPPAGGGRLLAMVLAATFLVRAVGANQPIVENYVGRQVPTAMVARNLERGSGLPGPGWTRRLCPITSWSSPRCMNSGWSP